MSEFGTLSVSVRNKNGKGVARTLRREGKIPGVMYGQGKPNLALTLDPNELKKATDPDKETNTLYTITVQEDGKSDVVESCVISDVQLDAIKREVLHVDFMRVDPEKEVVRTVPVKYTGRAAGVVKGGKMKTFRRSLRIAAKPIDIPVVIDINVTNVEGGESIRVKDIEVPGGRVVENPEQRVMFIEMPKVRAEEGEGDEGKKKKK